MDFASLGYAFRFLGDWSGNADFLALIGNTLIDGAHATFVFDGTYTGVSRLAELPEPGSLAMLLLGLGPMGALYRRRRSMMG